QAATPRPAGTARATGAPRSAGPARPAWAAGSAAATDRGLGRPEAGGLRVQAQLTGVLGAGDATGCQRAGGRARRGQARRRRAGMAGLTVTAGGAAFARADRGADAAASAVPAATGRAGLMPGAEVSALQVVGLRAAEALRVPARVVIAQVV